MMCATGTWTNGAPGSKIEVTCSSGGIGRHARFRAVWPQGRGSSTLPSSTKKLFKYFRHEERATYVMLPFARLETRQAWLVIEYNRSRSVPISLMEEERKR